MPNLFPKEIIDNTHHGHHFRYGKKSVAIYSIINKLEILDFNITGTNEFIHDLQFLTTNNLISLDSSSENYIQKTIQNLRANNKTIIVIAHRLSTIVQADTILVLEKGQLIDQGSHNE